MDIEIKNEFKKRSDEFEKLAIMIKNGFDQTASKNELDGVRQELNDKIDGLEQSLDGKINGLKEDLEEKIDEVSAKLQDQKQVPLVRKVDEKLNKEIEIHGRNKTLSKEEIAEINNLNPFPVKPVITS